MTDAYRLHKNQQDDARRKHLYATDPVWRLTKLKDCRERRTRKKRAAQAASLSSHEATKPRRKEA